MAEKAPASLDALDRSAAYRHHLSARPMPPAVAGRAKRALGDRFGLSQFGVNLTDAGAGLGVRAPPLA